MQPEQILGPEWKRGINGKVSSVYMTPDASFVAAGSGDHDVYLMNFSGKLIWASTTGDDVQYVKASDNGSCVASYSKDNIVSYFDKLGNLAWTCRIAKRINSMDMSPDGTLVVTGSEDGLVRAFSDKGQILWTKDCQKPVNSVAISSSGSLIVAGSSNKKAYMLTRSGDVRWEFIAQSPVLYVYTSSDGEFSYALEFTNLTTNAFHEISDRGGELSCNTYSQRIIDISITDDGRYVAIGFSNGFVYFTDKNGNLLWRQSLTAPIASIKVSCDGSLVFATTADKMLHVLNKKGSELLSHRFDGPTDSIGASFEGDYVAVGVADTVYMFAMGKLVEYVVREQVKISKLIKADETRRLKPEAGSDRYVPNTGLPDNGVNKCSICGSPILSSKTLCNYCEMMQRRTGTTGKTR